MREYCFNFESYLIIAKHYVSFYFRILFTFKNYFLQILLNASKNVIKKVS